VGKIFKTKRQEVISDCKNTSRTIKVFYLPTDAQKSCFKRILKFKNLKKQKKNIHEEFHNLYSSSN
jgi:hypothetical protein